MEAKITAEPFGALNDGTQVSLYTLTNSRGALARITNYGGIVQSLSVPDRNGVMGDVVLGYETLAEYVANNSPYLGSLIGRFGNRIAKARFSLNGKVYNLAANDKGNTLHGGVKGFDKVVWTPTTKVTAAGPALELRYTSQDGEDGYPGNLEVTAVYTLTEANELKLDFSAVTDQDTVVNLTHHSYFNLACKGDVLNHVLTLNSEAFTPVGPDLIPTGEVRPVSGTPLDFRKPLAIGAQIRSQDPIVKTVRGFDHNWVLNKAPGVLGLAARVEDVGSGRVMDVLTTAPAFQFYSGNFLDGSITGKKGQVYHQWTGLCIEPQHYPDSPNKPQFPSTLLKPGSTYRNTIIYRFSVV
jgi:aldose 1-epimerase